MLEILQTLQLLNPNPLIIPPQLTNEFHNWVKYKQWTPCINGCPYTTTPVIPPLPMALPLPLAELMLGIAITPFGPQFPRNIIWRPI